MRARELSTSTLTITPEDIVRTALYQHEWIDPARFQREARVVAQNRERQPTGQ